MRKFLSVMVLCLLLLTVVAAPGQQLQTGTIRGTVTDEGGLPLPGVNVVVTSPSLIGKFSAVTNQDGLYRVPALPPGTYTLTFEMPQFQTIKRVGVIVNVGATVTIDVQMQPAALSEEVVVQAASPVIDIQNTKIVTMVDSNLMRNLPMGRNLTNIINMSPGTVNSVIHGGTEISTTYEVDGVNVNDPSMNGRAVTVEFDAMEEIEIMTGGLPAQVGGTGGAFVNVVTRSGGNEFSCMAQGYYSPKALNQVLFTDEQLKSLGVGKPSFPVYSLQSSAMLGGPIIKDKVWFFVDFSYTGSKNVASFLPTTILGTPYDQYTPKSSNLAGFAKITTELAKNLRVFFMVNYSHPDTPYSGSGTYTTAEATQKRVDDNLAFTANASWIISSSTFADFRVGLNNMQWNILQQPGTENNYSYYDGYTYYYWGTTSRFSEPVWRNTIQASVRVTHFQDNFLGGDHEVKAGLEYQRGLDEWTWWKNNPINWYFYNGNPYYYRGLYGLSGPHPTYGDGLLYIYVCGPEDTPNKVNGTENRYGGFIQDSWTFKKRLNINLGVRFDYYDGFLPESNKAVTPGIAPSIGEALFVPTYGFNPYGELTIPRWNHVMSWGAISPRIGLSYDLFGTGKTVFKAAYSHYAEAMPVMYFQTLHPLRPVSYGFYWTDNNGNAIPDEYGVDTYVAFGSSPAAMLESYYKKRVQPDIKAPYYHEITASITHELVRDFSVGLQYIYKTKKNTVSAILYDPVSDRFWNSYEKAPDWWIPFTTTIPAVGNFPAQELTMYFMSANAPAQVTCFANVPEAKRFYQAVELIFSKRYSHGWQLGGSIVWSQTKGNNTDDYGSVWGYSGAYANPNWFVNRYGYIGSDRPLVIKLYGTFKTVGGLIASFYATYYSGSPWQRTVTVYPPSAWAAANNALGLSYSVNVEPSGSRRNQARTNVDFRLEKEFVLGSLGKIGFFVDVFNLLGNTYVNVSMNPAGTWRPTDINVTTGTYTVSSSYGKVTSVDGVRTFRLSARFSF